LLVVLLMAGVWSVRFAGVEQVGALTVAAGLVTVGLILRKRQQPFSSLGLKKPDSTRDMFASSLKLFALFGVVWMLMGAAVTYLIGQPETSSAISEQPQSWLGFLFDITLVTWGLIAFGEEAVFRGFILQRLVLALGESTLRRHLAIGIQSVIFGLGHASQGTSGMLLTAAIGYLFGWYFLGQAKRSLWPLVLVHGTADTIVLTIAFVV